ncbi:hypothetical protein H0P51_16460 [Mycobacterium vicinigordonae]|uniref:Uncharacterized protein n=2 Tax=Mycobacterium vicinigordonae TaxID=1719132 RepID=A0A7D6HYQ0_9MYCO|nr:hypothetical protein H0P51_16460 [Mycobacterium vicinigordonae]
MITPDQLATGTSKISALLRALGAAANAGDATDNGEAQAGHAEREAKTNEALAKFPANEDQAAARLAGVGGQGEMSQMLQQMPQMASGIAGGIAGALGGLLQPFSQIPQQLAQAGQQAMQAGMGMMHGAGGGEITPGELLADEGEFGGGSGFSGGGGAASGGGGGGVEGTTPTAILGPPPTPSAGTVPASSQAVSPVTPAPHDAPSAQRGAMGAMPMMPPGALNGGASSGGEAKPDTKRIVGPTVKNGAPVQGRITTPPPKPAVVKHIEGKPVATRRILTPDKLREGIAEDTDR